MHSEPILFIMFTSGLSSVVHYFCVFVCILRI